MPTAERKTKTKIVNRCFSLLTAAIILCLALPVHASSWNARDVLRAYVKANYPWPEIAVTDIHLSGPMPQEAPVRIRLDKGAIPGRASFRLEFRRGATVTAAAMIQVYDRVVMSRRALGKGSVLRDDVLFESLVELRRIPQNAAQDAGRITGKRLARSVLANRPITEDMIESGTLLKKGARISLVFDTSGFSIRTAGELKQNAAVGQYVEVVNVTSKKVLTGMLVDKNTVQVEY